ncbi:Crp/Fnr family transcriptional regulator [Leptospira ilyithenensis]|uniref:Cyclic nucleotide-binding domain-containing protein n=1 Tax=Leptospira ilyithenensis TaxID=2484901 RepID=A0A4R9LJB2_9LEPT|nr:cyclic nucleotide-binding domain-containing protein [Leptospira ilyithenensis]TGN06913.1 cyclic nucleotide-binding domain-containing protein [Leptospira ilyithenensis]
MSLPRKENRINIFDFVNTVPTKSFKKGEIIVREGEPSNEKMYFILSGTLSVGMGNPEQKNFHEVRKLTTGEFFGEIALISAHPRTMTVYIESDRAQLGILDKQNLTKIANSNPMFVYALLQTYVERLIEAEQKLKELTDGT